jgi:hypothetical protein
VQSEEIVRLCASLLAADAALRHAATVFKAYRKEIGHHHPKFKRLYAEVGKHG